MADQNNHGFRKFILDPKSSVMTYIADNIPPEHMSHQQGSSGRLQGGPINGPQSSVQDPNRLQQNQILSQSSQYQSQDDFMHPPLPTRPSQSNSQSASPRPGYAQPVQNSQMPMSTPYVASNVSQANQGLNAYAGAQTQLPGSQSISNPSMAQETMSQQGLQSHFSSVQNGTPSTATVGQGPPQPGARRRNSPQSAPRLYHRMMLEYEMTKKAFFLAKSQRNTQETASTAYELESSSRRIWSLRHEHSWEFEGYSEAGHQAVFSKWQAEYEMWADVVLDIQDGQVLADAANSSQYGNSSMRGDEEGLDSQSRQARSGFQELNAEDKLHGQSTQEEQRPLQTPQQMPPPPPPQQQIIPQQPMHPHQQMQPQQQMLPQQQMPSQQQQFFPPQQMPQQQQISPQQQQYPPPQQMPQQMPQQLQNLSIGHSTPPPQTMQTIQPPQQTPPGAFPQSAPPPPINDHPIPPHQRPQSPAMPLAQSPPPPNMQNEQNMQPGRFDASPGVPNMPAGPRRNTQQSTNPSRPEVQQLQDYRPGQTPPVRQGQNRPPQQYLQQQQQQQQNVGPGPQGPPRYAAPQGQNMGPGRNPSPRPGSQVPPGLQPGGQMMGDRRQ